MASIELQPYISDKELVEYYRILYENSQKMINDNEDTIKKFQNKLDELEDMNNVLNMENEELRKENIELKETVHELHSNNEIANITIEYFYENHNS
tara:strand:- start:89 stop:376 length:288 start_codon:yes stop_codon:yes gene_type:complete